MSAVKNIGVDEASEADHFACMIFHIGKIGVVVAEIEIGNRFEFFYDFERAFGFCFRCCSPYFCLGIELFDLKAREDKVMVEKSCGSQIDDAGIGENGGVDDEDLFSCAPWE